ncbi:MAG: nitroreductase/quinone reductase family protein [Chloroflexota bacterium]
MMDQNIQTALENDEVIDITTIGRKSGQPRRIEIWFRQVNGRIYITGTPGTRHWYANMLANPRITFHLKQSVTADLPATVHPITDNAARRQIFSDPVMRWYHQRAQDIEALVERSPLVEVIFD